MIEHDQEGKDAPVPWQLDKCASVRVFCCQDTCVSDTCRQLSVGARSRQSESEVRGPCGPWQISIHSHEVSCDSEGSFGFKGIVMISVQIQTNESGLGPLFQRTQNVRTRELCRCLLLLNGRDQPCGGHVRMIETSKAPSCRAGWDAFVAVHRMCSFCLMPGFVLQR